MGKAFEKQIKTIEDQGKTQVEVLKDLKPRNQTKAFKDKSDNKLSIMNKTLKEIEKDQKKFKSSLGQMTLGNSEHKGNYQKDAIKNAKNLYNSRQKVIDLFNDSAKIRSEAIYKSKQNETKDKVNTIIKMGAIFMN